ncbi:MAG: hypothetical protein E6J87_14490 [Deltaproteobacteria bacterium]|nr:MAG: hypothetical protein E6J87_14490 [Deltaproteobacteria bacterium]
MGRLSVVVLFTPELARQREFYEKTLGLTAAGGDARWVQFGTGDAALALRALAGGEAPRIEMGFDVAALEPHLKLLSSRGVEPKEKLEESADCRLARVHDPEGNVIQLVERRKPTASNQRPRLSHAIVNAQRFEACAHFYHDALGCKIAEEREHWIEFDTGSAHLTLHAWRDADGLPLSPDQRVSFALMSEDLDVWADELRGRGVRFATTPTEEEMGRMAEVEDVDGWFVVLRGPSPEVPLEEALAEEYADEDGTRIEQIRKTGDTDSGTRPAFGSRKLARKKVERVVTRGFEAMQRTRDVERGGFTPGGSTGSRPGYGSASRPPGPRPAGSGPPSGPPGARPAGAPPSGMRSTGDRPAPAGSRPTGYPGAAPRPTSRPDRPFTPRSDSPRPGGFRREGGPTGPAGPRPAGPRPPSGPRPGGPPASGTPASRPPASRPPAGRPPASGPRRDES